MVEVAFSQVLMERIRATSKMSFISGGLSQKTVIASNNNNQLITDTHKHNPSSNFSSNFFIPPSDHHHHHHFLARCTIVDDSSELSIFDAKKYFNEVSPNHINKVSPITSLDPTTMPEDHLFEAQDSDQDSESRSKSWACGVTHPVSPTVVSKFSPSSASAPVDGYRHRSYRARSFHSATPTASSEASWNSQTGLLSNPPGAISVSVLRGDSDHHLEKKTRKPSSTSSAAARWIFRSSKCPCSGKKSVQVQESKVIVSSDHAKTSPPYSNNKPHTASPPQPESPPDPVKSVVSMVLQQSDHNDVVWSTQRRFPPNLLLQGQTTTQRVIASNGFTFPILKNNNGEFPIRALNTSLIQDPPRDSLEVFKPNSAQDDGGCIDSGGSLKSRILASAAASGATTATIDIDDVASDASSDLFEIESFSTQTTSMAATYPAAMFHRRDSMELEARRLTRRSLDDPMMPSAEWYEPSEASIDWSVTTAEGFDRASIANMSEADELPTEKNNNNNRRRSSSGSGLLSCRSEKAVSVGPQPVKFITAGEKKVHVGSRPPLGKKPPLARSNSARQSLAFAA